MVLDRPDRRPGVHGHDRRVGPDAELEPALEDRAQRVHRPRTIRADPSLVELARMTPRGVERRLHRGRRSRASRRARSARGSASRSARSGVAARGSGGAPGSQGDGRSAPTRRAPARSRGPRSRASRPAGRRRARRGRSPRGSSSSNASSPVPGPSTYGSPIAAVRAPIDPSAGEVAADRLEAEFHGLGHVHRRQGRPPRTPADRRGARGGCRGPRPELQRQRHLMHRRDAGAGGSRRTRTAAGPRSRGRTGRSPPSGRRDGWPCR